MEYADQLYTDVSHTQPAEYGKTELSLMHFTVCFLSVWYSCCTLILDTFHLLVTYNAKLDIVSFCTDGVLVIDNLSHVEIFTSVCSYERSGVKYSYGVY